MEYYKSLLASLRDITSKMSVKARFEVAVGDPADQLVRHADRYGVNLIVLGHRGHSKLVRWLFGSISEEVEHYPGCPVLVVR
jgi:nucleotide-binding universal stress UspA family protein